MQSRKKELEKKLNQTGFLKGNEASRYRSTSPGLWVPPTGPLATVDTSPALHCQPAALGNQGIPAPPPPPPLAGSEMVQYPDWISGNRGRLN